MKKWQCTVCKYIHEGDEPPEKCPICGVPASKFILLEDDGADSGAKDTSKAPETAQADSKPKEQATPAAPKAAPEPGPEPKTFYEKLVRFMVRHHAHPVSVHTPNGILPAAVILFVLAWLFGSGLFVKAGFINMVFVVLSLPLVLYTGILEWQKKYAGALTPIFKVKILAATVTATGCLISLAWYLIDPGVMASAKAWVFILINLVALAAAGIAGHIGGKLVFKD